MLLASAYNAACRDDMIDSLEHELAIAASAMVAVIIGEHPSRLISRDKSEAPATSSFSVVRIPLPGPDSEGVFVEVN